MAAGRGEVGIVDMLLMEMGDEKKKYLQMTNEVGDACMVWQLSGAYIATL